MILVGLIFIVLLFVACSAREVTMTDAVKTFPVSGGSGNVYVGRSEFWDKGNSGSHPSENRQTFVFIPPEHLALYVELENMGGVPLHRDTMRSKTYRFADLYLRTATRDTNLQIHIELSDKTKPPTDVSVFVRDVDTVCSQIRFEGMKPH